MEERFGCLPGLARVLLTLNFLNFTLNNGNVILMLYFGNTYLFHCRTHSHGLSRQCQHIVRWVAQYLVCRPGQVNITSAAQIAMHRLKLLLVSSHRPQRNLTEGERNWEIIIELKAVHSTDIAMVIKWPLMSLLGALPINRLDCLDS